MNSMNIDILLNSPNARVVVVQAGLPPPCPAFRGEQMRSSVCVVILMIEVGDVDVIA
jgi:hypothetical protein